MLADNVGDFDDRSKFQSGGGRRVFLLEFREERVVHLEKVFPQMELEIKERNVNFLISAD